MVALSGALALSFTLSLSLRFAGLWTVVIQLCDGDDGRRENRAKDFTRSKVEHERMPHLSLKIPFLFESKSAWAPKSRKMNSLERH